jgi:chorismate synthase
MLRFHTAGESHGQALLAFLSGLPAGLRVDFAYVNRELKRRQGGYGRGGRMKIESDAAQFLSGVRHGQTIATTGRIGKRPWRLRTIPHRAPSTNRFLLPGPGTPIWQAA